MAEVDVAGSGADVVGGRQQNDDTDVSTQFDHFLDVKSMFQPVAFSNLYTSISVDSRFTIQCRMQFIETRNQFTYGT